MVDFEKDLNRAEFLKKNSPLAEKDKSTVSPPPLFSQEEKVSILGNSEELQEKKTSVSLNKLRFWDNWKEKHYTYASLGLALLLVGYVGISVSGFGSGDTSLNATLTVPEPSQEETEQNEESSSDQVIDSEVVDSSIVIEEIEKDSSSEEPSDITEYIFESYDF